jgi:G3E family GTPase
VADPGSLLKLVHTRPNIVAQIEAADVVLLNKTDLFAEDQVRATKAELRQIKPTARVVRSVFSRAGVEPFPPVINRRQLSGESAPCRDPHYESATIEFGHDVDLGRLRQDLLALGDELYRVKGFVRAGGRFHYLDYSQAGLAITPATGSGHAASLALVLTNPVSHATADFLRRMRSVSGV